MTDIESPEVLEVLASLRMGEQGIHLGDDDARRLRGKFEVVDDGRKKVVVRELLAAAVKIKRAAEDLADTALFQLMEFAAILLVDNARAREAMEAVTGGEISKVPVGSTKVDGAVSPMGARFFKGPDK